MDSKPYHHGDLRSALLAAAEAELAAKGVEGFSLRAVAKRAGVSHAAPAHHFGDVQGLLTALAAEGFRQLLAAQARREAGVPDTPREQMLAAGLGYVDFAIGRPALFRLIFSSMLPDHAEPGLNAAGTAAYGHLSDQVAALGGGPDAVALIWAATHGIADLVGSGRLKTLSALTGAARDRAIAVLLDRAVGAALA